MEYIIGGLLLWALLSIVVAGLMSLFFRINKREDD